MSKVRNSNIELLRIVAMLLIVMSHFATHGTWPELTGLNGAIINVMSSFGNLGVDIFVLITGYFLVMSNFKVRAFSKVLCPMIFWNVLFGGLFLLTNQVPSLGALVEIPWFCIAYLLMYLFVPWLNLLARGMGKAGYRLLIAIGIILFSAVPSATGSQFTSSVLGWFLFLYLVGGYIRLHGVRMSTVGVTFCLILSLALLTLGLSLPIIYDTPNALPHSLFAARNSVFVYGAAVCALELSGRARIHQSRLINKVASLTFGVYLIHDNACIRAWLWPHFAWLFNGGSLTFFAAAFCISFVVFCCCALLECVRQWLSGICLGKCGSNDALSACVRIDELFREV